MALVLRLKRMISIIRRLLHAHATHRMAAVSVDWIQGGVGGGRAGTSAGLGAFVWIWSRSWIYERSLDVIDSCCFSTRSRSLPCIASILLCERSLDVIDSCCFWTRFRSWPCERSLDVSDSCCFSTRSRSLPCIASILSCERSLDVSDSCCFWTMSCSSLCERLWEVNVTTIAIP